MAAMQPISPDTNGETDDGHDHQAHDQRVDRLSSLPRFGTAQDSAGVMHAWLGYGDGVHPHGCHPGMGDGEGSRTARSVPERLAIPQPRRH